MNIKTSKNKPDREVLEKYLLSAPFHQWLGLKLKNADDFSVEVELPWREEIVSNVHGQITHGGILAALIDLTGHLAIVAKTGVLPQRVATIDIRVDYHRAATPGKLAASGEVMNLGKKVSSVQISVHDEKDNLMASGKGVYLITG
jgi:uncharacterized protein (TIGR00369 family)